MLRGSVFNSQGARRSWKPSSKTLRGERWRGRGGSTLCARGCASFRAAVRALPWPRVLSKGVNPSGA